MIETGTKYININTRLLLTSLKNDSQNRGIFNTNYKHPNTQKYYRQTMTANDHQVAWELGLYHPRIRELGLSQSKSNPK